MRGAVQPIGKRYVRARLGVTIRVDGNPDAAVPQLFAHVLYRAVQLVQVYRGKRMP